MFAQAQPAGLVEAPRVEERVQCAALRSGLAARASRTRAATVALDSVSSACG